MTLELQRQVGGHRSRGVVTAGVRGSGRATEGSCMGRHHCPRPGTTGSSRGRAGARAMKVATVSSVKDERQQGEGSASRWPHTGLGGACVPLCTPASAYDLLYQCRPSGALGTLIVGLEFTELALVRMTCPPPSGAFIHIPVGGGGGSGGTPRRGGGGPCSWEVGGPEAGEVGRPHANGRLSFQWTRSSGCGRAASRDAGHGTGGVPRPHPGG